MKPSEHKEFINNHAMCRKLVAETEKRKRKADIITNESPFINWALIDNMENSR